MSEENYTSQNSATQDYYSTGTNSLPYIDTPPQLPHKQPVQQPPEPSANPTETGQLAATHHLGSVEREYENNAERHLIVGIPFCILGVVAIFFLPSIFHAFSPQLFRVMGRGMLMAFAGGIISLGYGIGCVSRGINNAVINIRHHSPRISLYTHGIMIIQRKQMQAIRWDQVRAVQKILYADKSDIPYQFLFYLSERDEPIVLDRIVIRFKVLCAQIERALAPQLLSTAIADHKAGEILNFGAINVTQQGLSIEEEQKSLPWDNIGDLDEQEGYLTIKEKDTSSLWAEIDESMMLNRCIFLPLIRQLRDENNKRKAAQKFVYRQPTSELQSEWLEYEQ